MTSEFTQDNTTIELISEQSTHHLQTNDEQVTHISEAIISNSDNLVKENSLTDTPQEMPTKHIENDDIDKSDNTRHCYVTTMSKWSHISKECFSVFIISL